MAFGERSNETLSQINVTPLVDVMLVLLVIFMVTAPILQQGVSVDLPHVKAGALAADEVQLVVSVTEDGALFLNDTALSSAALRDKLAAILRDQPAKQVFLRADEAARYGTVMEVLAALRGAGVQRLGMVTEAPPGQP
jgi:biopolymer transport protein TolR